jgi:CubicO group peptidase (beta-lactamase class C family)
MRLLIALTLLAASASVSAQQLSSDTAARVAAIANDVLQQTGVPSASVGIVQGGRVVYTQAFGLADIATHKPATPQMAYPIGSISKQFTSTAVLLLQQQGKLSIDDPVAKYFPELTRANDVKLRNLMTMTSGYEDFAPQDYSIPAWYQPEDPAKTVHEWATKPLDFEPGTQWQYSNTNYVLLALIVEKVTGEPFYKFLRSTVLDPLQLPGIFNAYTNREQLQVTGYISYAMQPPRVLPLEAPSWYFGDAELAMPASTLLQWDMSIINQSLLSPASYKLMEAPFITSTGKDTNYGLGVHIADHDGHLQLEHGGEVGGYAAENIVYPNDKIAIVVLTNEAASEAASEIAEQITPLLLPPSASPTPLSADADPVAKQLPAILAVFAKGQIDRSLFTANCNSYFSPGPLQDFQATLAPLGAVTGVTRTRSALRGGMTFGLYRITFANGTALMLDTYTLPNGKIEQLLILGKG